MRRVDGNKVMTAIMILGLHFAFFGWVFFLYDMTLSVPKRFSYDDYDYQINGMMVNLPLISQSSITFIGEGPGEIVCGTSHPHCHEDGTIHISVEQLQGSPNTFYHEFGHAHHLRLNQQGSDFERRWRSVGGNALEDIHEDVARHVRQAYQDRYGNGPVYYNGANQEYIQKLDLLKEYGFIR